MVMCQIVKDKLTSSENNEQGKNVCNERIVHISFGFICGWPTNQNTSGMGQLR